MITKRFLTVFMLSVVALFYSCQKSTINIFSQLRPMSSYNLSAYSGSQLLTFNSNASGIDSTIYSSITINGSWYGADPGVDTYDITLKSAPISKGYVGTYNLTATFGSWNGNGPSGNIFVYTSQNPCYLSITAFDSINRTISGTFSFSGTGGAGAGNNNKYPSTVTISNGVFTKVPIQ